MLIQPELNLISNDWGESNFNPMVRAWGLKRDRKAKCKSCVHFFHDKCNFTCPFGHSAEYRACIRYRSKRSSK